MTEPEDQWDAVVVGAGMGGLVCAAYLATSGKRVLVLEQHDVAGGNSHVFRRRRAYEFDVGVHYLGDCGPDGVLPAILAGVGLADRVKFREMDPDGYDRIVLPGLEVDVPADWPTLRTRLRQAFPEDATAIDSFLDISQAIGAELRAGLLSESEVSPSDLARRTPEVVRWNNRPLTELFDHCGLPVRARTVLSAQTLNFGMGPDQISVSMHASVTDHYLRGSYYPEGGSQVMAASLVETIEAHGGALRTKSRVGRILVEQGRAGGVELVGGERIKAPLVVSNADFPRTVLELVGPDHFPPALVARTRETEMALPLAVAYVGLDIDLGDRRNANLLWHRGEDISESYRQLATGDWDELPALFVSFASIKDPGSRAVCPEGHSNFQVLVMCPPGYEQWGVREGPSSGGRYRRNADYRAAKDRLTEAIVRGTETAIGPFREHITHLEVATPLTQERYTRSTGGVSFGMTRWGGQIARPDVRTSVSGLFVVGQSTRYGTGIAGVAISGIACAGEILGRRLLSEVHRGAVFADRELLPERLPGWDPLRVSRGTARRNARGLAGSGRGAR
ncbi:phytoene dehydrogenase [Amycolatopsis coloradensis]|uniref:Phytoene dehydrogenase n=1 Tax=Amycolatopsis coloradensis TaxID=76021 RepID=A0A1R0KQQ5_9PSEU|nr:NAD(P)/FAD-dependent oxidoreductase [Amycolatopsis coloradensis]OLZ50020.1 phytoene dehydrogenase [Amycolatopsis coloradensis]